ncbi:MAG TPA: 3-ketoacyl-ACP reductase [Verrucomicrobiae bacterium]|nr:3-ketoacyl-ACP reductase [Verrucomicrobiae bacterium]
MKRVALITGGSRGIGFGIAQALARDGFDLAVCGVRQESAAADALAELRQLGAEVLYCQCDVADRDARARMIVAVRQRFGRLDVLVNNAGIAPKERRDILEATEESFEQVMRTNLQGPYFLTQTVANWMVEQRKAEADFSGCIVNVSSISATVASVNRGEYCLSKAGIAMATQLWAARLGEFDIPVYEVRPGVIKTDMTAGVQAKYDKLFGEGLAIQSRWGLPEDVGKAVASLARGDFPYSTGQVVMVDGGLTIQRL